MGLDACVYCNCYETENLREPPPISAAISVSPDGSLDCGNVDLNDALAFDRWLNNKACEHQDGVLLHHRLGNIALVSLLRNELGREPDRFHILLGKVLYSGTHGGDWLGIEDVSALAKELDMLDGFAASKPDNQVFVDQFRSQMRELADLALQVGKPIAF